MECRKFKLTLISAGNLPAVRFSGRMKVYAEVSINGDSNKSSMKTGVDKEGETNPRWDVRLNYIVKESAVQQPGANVVVKLFCKRTLRDTFIGEVKIPVKSLFDMGLKAENLVSYSVEGTPNGVLYISYRFGDKIMVPNGSGWAKGLRDIGLGVVAEGVKILATG